MIRSGNPALGRRTFTNFNQQAIGERMTLDGAVNKTSIALSILILCAYYTFISSNTSFIMLGCIGGFIIALITIFKKEWSSITVPIYAALEGLALGGISAIYNHAYTGIVQQAIFLTLGIFAALLFAYKTKIIKPTENFKLGIFAATAGIGIVYMIHFIMSLFGGNGLSILSINNVSTFSIGFNLFIVIIASLNLVLDFDFIERGVEAGAPKYMEWYSAFGLLITLIWLYVAILKLLSRMNSRR